jgi:hypothetical protein
VQYKCIEPLLSRTNLISLLDIVFRQVDFARRF